MLAKYQPLLVSFILVLGVVFFSFRYGLEVVPFDVDMQRDLYELSNIWIGKTVWLGPYLSPGLHASSIYYYMFYPLLWILGGTGYAFLLTNLMIGMLVLWYLAYESLYKFGSWGGLIPVFIALSPWWQQILIHPGNGYTYTFFVLLGVALLYFRKALFLSALSIGIAISFHPVAVVVVPLLIFSLWKAKNKVVSVLKLVIALLIPWTPVIGYEIITKGFIVRQWLERPSSGLSFSLNILNFETITQWWDFNFWLLMVVWICLGFKVKRILQQYYWIISVFLIVLLFIKQVPDYYLLGIVAMMSLVFVMTLIQFSIGKVLLGFMIVWYVGVAVQQPPPSAEMRTLSSVEVIVDGVVSSQIVVKSDQLAVIAATGGDNLVPQAYDYRFFLRMKGFDVLDITEYSQADRLLMLVEDDQFDWRKWSTWEIEQFGAKEVVSELLINDVRVVVFQSI